MSSAGKSASRTSASFQPKSHDVERPLARKTSSGRIQRRHRLGKNAKWMWRPRMRGTAARSRGSIASFTPSKVTKVRFAAVDSAAVTACGSFSRFTLSTPTRSRRRRPAAGALRALTTRQPRPRRAPAIAVMTAPPPTVRTSVGVLISSPGLGSRSRLAKMRSSKASPIVTSSVTGTARSHYRERCAASRNPSNSGRNSPVRKKFSGCHCTPRQNGAPGSSTASMTPSGAVAATLNPGARRFTAWW